MYVAVPGPNASLGLAIFAASLSEATSIPLSRAGGMGPDAPSGIDIPTLKEFLARSSPQLGDRCPLAFLPTEGVDSSLVQAATVLSEARNGEGDTQSVLGSANLLWKGGAALLDTDTLLSGEALRFLVGEWVYLSTPQIHPLETLLEEGRKLAAKGHHRLAVAYFERAITLGLTGHMTARARNQLIRQFREVDSPTERSRLLMLLAESLAAVGDPTGAVKVYREGPLDVISGQIQAKNTEVALKLLEEVAGSIGRAELDLETKLDLLTAVVTQTSIPQNEKVYAAACERIRRRVCDALPAMSEDGRLAERLEALRSLLSA